MLFQNIYRTKTCMTLPPIILNLHNMICQDAFEWFLHSWSSYLTLILHILDSPHTEWRMKNIIWMTTKIFFPWNDFFHFYKNTSKKLVIDIKTLSPHLARALSNLVILHQHPWPLLTLKRIETRLWSLHLILSCIPFPSSCFCSPFWHVWMRVREMFTLDEVECSSLPLTSSFHYRYEIIITQQWPKWMESSWFVHRWICMGHKMPSLSPV